jgi:hypothetical protein
VLAIRFEAGVRHAFKMVVFKSYLGSYVPFTLNWLGNCIKQCIIWIMNKDKYILTKIFSSLDDLYILLQSLEKTLET